MQARGAQRCPLLRAHEPSLAWPLTSAGTTVCDGREARKFLLSFSPAGFRPRMLRGRSGDNSLECSDCVLAVVARKIRVSQSGQCAGIARLRCQSRRLEIADRVLQAATQYLWNHQVPTTEKVTRITMARSLTEAPLGVSSNRRCKASPECSG